MGRNDKVTTLRKPFVHVIESSTNAHEDVADLLNGIGIEVLMHHDAAGFLSTDSCSDCVLIMDLRLRGMSGLILQSRLATKSNLEIIFVTRAAEVQDCVSAMKAGAHDFLVAPFRAQELIDTVVLAIEKLRSRRVTSERNVRLSANIERLTPAEREIAYLVGQGCPIRQIAKLTGRAENTVKVHRTRLLQKLGISSSAQLGSTLQSLDGLIPPTYAASAASVATVPW